MASDKTTTKTRKQPSSTDLTGSAARARLARVSRFPLRDPMQIEYGDSRWRLTQGSMRYREGAASFVVG